MCMEGWRRKAGLNLLQNQPFEALHHYGRECNRAKVIEAVCGGFSGEWWEARDCWGAETEWFSAAVVWDLV